MFVKVCGIVNYLQARELDTLHIPFIGYNFYEKSKRYVTPDSNSLIREKLSFAKKVGVFVNKPVQDILEIAKKYHLDYVQLHGLNESLEVCSKIKDKGVGVIKVFSSNQIRQALIDPFQNKVDFFLFDTSSIALGGSGKMFDWNLLDSVRVSQPYFLSGGISYQNISEIAKHQDKHPFFRGVDINSCFELKPGLKNIELINKFFFGLTKMRK